MTGALVAAGNANGGTDYDPSLHLAMLDPLYVPDAGSQGLLPYYSLLDYRVVNGMLISRWDFPGIDLGYQWLWWENYDANTFNNTTINVEAFQGGLLSMAIFYEQAIHSGIINSIYNDYTNAQWQSYFASTNHLSSPPLPIVAILQNLIRQFGINAAADFLIQLFFEYLTNEDGDLGDALVNVDWLQVERSGAEGCISLKGTTGKVVKAGVTGAGDVIFKFTRKGKGEDYTVEDALQDFALGFTSDLAGGELSSLAAKYPIDKLAKGLIKKFNFPYSKVCKWVGKGLEQINKSFTHTIVENGIQRTITIEAKRQMKGWADGKVAVIGRNMHDRVIPFSTKLSQEINTPVIYWSGFDPNLNDLENLAKNKEWIKNLQMQGYTFIDIGLDPAYTARGDYSKGIFYEMELREIFNE